MAKNSAKYSVVKHLRNTCLILLLNLHLLLSIDANLYNTYTLSLKKEEYFLARIFSSTWIAKHSCLLPLFVVMKNICVYMRKWIPIMEVHSLHTDKPQGIWDLLRVKEGIFEGAPCQNTESTSWTALELPLLPSNCTFSVLNHKPHWLWCCSRCSKTFMALLGTLNFILTRLIFPFINYTIPSKHSVSQQLFFFFQNLKKYVNCINFFYI